MIPIDLPAGRCLRRLGRRAHDPAQLASVHTLGRYLGTQSPGRAIDWTRDIAHGTWGMCDNDTLSDCTAAAVSHAISTWESYVPPLSFMSDREIVQLYSATGGYVAGDPTTDRGAVCLDVLNYWTHNEVGGETLAAFCAVDPKNPAHVRIALEVFGGLYVGVTLREAQLQGSGKWDRTTDTIAGGHCIWTVAVDDDGLTCITWGETQRMTWAFWNAAVDECYALLSPRWARAGRTPEGFPIAAMIADMPALSAPRG
ncbi:MAG: hypothetical protein ABI224_14080 [Acetobacteraceae bacterium]